MSTGTPALSTSRHAQPRTALAFDSNVANRVLEKWLRQVASAALAAPTGDRAFLFVRHVPRLPRHPCPATPVPPHWDAAFPHSLRLPLNQLPAPARWIEPNFWPKRSQTDVRVQALSSAK